MTDPENSSDEASVTGTVRAMFSESSDCVCCEGPHRFSTGLDLDRRVSPYDSSNDIASFVFNRLHHMPDGAQVRVTVEEVVNSSDEARLPLTGHDRVVIDKLADVLHAEAGWQGEEGPLQEDPRGNHFEVRLTSGHVAKVTVVLDRIEGDGRG